MLRVAGITPISVITHSMLSMHMTELAVKSEMNPMPSSPVTLYGVVDKGVHSIL